MKTIKEYIQFTIDNGYILTINKDTYGKQFYFYIEDNNTIIITKDGEMFNEGNIIELITSKKFIEAIAKGLGDYAGYGSTYNIRFNKITIEQAIAIRDDKLDLFINELLGKR